MKHLPFLFLILLCYVLPFAASRLIDARLPIAVGYHSVATVGDLVITAGGYGESGAQAYYSAAVSLLNITSELITTATPMSLARSSMSTSVVGNKVYFIGGEYDSTATCYPSTDVIDILTLPESTWATTRLSSARKLSRFGTVGGPLNEYAVIAGGFNVGGPTCNTYSYLSSIETIPSSSSTATLSSVRGYFASEYARLDNSDIFAFAGGRNAATYFDTVEYYNATSGTLFLLNFLISMGLKQFKATSTIIPSTERLRSPMYLGAAAVAENRYLVVAGGRTGSTYGLPNIDVFDMRTRNRVATLSMTTSGRYNLAAAALGPYVYIAGGRTPSDTILSDVDVVDTRDMTVFPFSEKLSKPLELLVGTSVPGVAAVFTGGLSTGGYVTDIHVFKCGNGVVDFGYGELCDVHIPGCYKNCTGFNSPPPTPTPIPTPTLSPITPLIPSLPPNSDLSPSATSSESPPISSPEIVPTPISTSHDISPIISPINSPTPSLAPIELIDSSSDPEDQDLIFILVGMILGVLFFSTVIIIALVFLRYKKKKRNDNATYYIRVDPIPDSPHAFPTSYHAYFSLSGYVDGTETATKVLVPDSNEYKFAMHLFKALDGEDLIPSIVKVTAVLNPRVASSFENHKIALWKGLTTQPELFAKKTWRNIADRQELRQWVIEQFGVLVSQFPWNHGANLSEIQSPQSYTSTAVVPSCHGTDARVANQILETGFSALSSLDAGYYGRGTYFSSSARYTLPYCYPRKSPAIMLCLCIPGNPHPIVEDREEPKSHLGMPIQTGYQSNYVLTRRDGTPCTFKGGEVFDELVLDQEAQVVPIVIIELDPDKLTNIARDFQREIPDT